MTRVEIDEAVFLSSAGIVSTVRGASVQVNIRGGGAATVFAAEVGGSTLSNPLTTDIAGRINGWLDAGSYDLIVSGSSITSYTQPYEAAAVGPAGPAGSAGVGANWRGVWSSGTTYALADGVYRNGLPYISNVGSNLNHDPATDTGTNWGVIAGATPLGVDVWNSQSNPASVTDWGAIVNTMLAGGKRLLYFGPHDFPITTKIDLSSTTGVTFQGSGGAGYGTQFWTATPTRLIWKNGAGSGNCIDGGFAAMGFSLRDLGVYYDNALYNGDLIAFLNAACRAVGCAFGSLNGTQTTARSLLKMYQSVSCIVEWCNFSGAIDAIRGHETGGTGVCDNDDILNCVFENCSNSFICNPGRNWSIQRNTMEFGFGSSATPYGVTSDLPGGSEANVHFTFSDNRLWDMTNNTQIGLYEPAACTWDLLAEGNFFDIKPGFKFAGGGGATSVVTLRHNYWSRTFVAGDPSPIDLGTTVRTFLEEKNVMAINAGGPPRLANAASHKYLTSEKQFTTNAGHVRSAPLATNPTIATHGTPANVTGVALFGTDEAGVIEIGVGGGGATPTGLLADITFTVAQLPVPSGGGNTIVIIAPYEIQGYTTGIVGAAAANAYASTSGNAGFTIGVQIALPASGRYHFAYRVIQT